MTTALILLGCPELPVQTSLTLYLLNGLRDAGVEVTVSGTDAALSLLEVADPKGLYVDQAELHNLDTCIESLAEQRRDFDFCVVFVHSDSGLSYLGTVQSISKARLVAIIFGREADALAKQITFKCKTLVAKAVHNPSPFKKQIDRLVEEVKQWAVSR
jgi:hypothetical protein